MCSSPLIVFRALLLTCCTMSDFLILRLPKLDAILQVRSHKNEIKGHNHLPWPAGRTSFHSAQDIIDFLGHSCWFISNISSTNIPKSFSAGLLSVHLLLHVCGCWWLPRPRGRTLHLALFSFTRLTLPTSQACQDLSGWHTFPQEH